MILWNNIYNLYGLIFPKSDTNEQNSYRHCFRDRVNCLHFFILCGTEMYQYSKGASSSVPTQF